MIKHALILLIFLSASQLFAQGSLNMEELFNWDDNTLPSQSGVVYNDIWGYTDDEGREYAIMGGARNIFFFEITDPENTRLIRRVDDQDPDISGNVDLDPTIWRDFKTYGEKAYSVADQGNEGLIVFDLSELPDTVTVETQITTFFTQSHNIYVDEDAGRLYTAGANVGGGVDVVVLDLTTDPIEEIASVSIAGGYIHDIHVVNDTAYCNSGNDGLYVYDFTDAANPAYITDLSSYTGSGYNHSGWLTADGDHYVFCDETQGRKVKILDVTDLVGLSNVDITDQFYSNLLDEDDPTPNSLAHNPFIIGDLVYVAYYDDGVQIFDISDPENVVREAYYDTNNNTTYNNDGVWGVYPFFESGSIIASDILNGLFVLEMTEGPLPVELIEFTAQPENEEVKLHWTTQSEINSSVFEVERSGNGEEFYSIKGVEAKGNSDQNTHYSTIDASPLPGTNYYRLKMVDVDGKFEYSEVVVIEFDKIKVSIFPTYVAGDPSVQLVAADLLEVLTVELIKPSGQIVQSLQYFNTNQVTFSVEDIPNGIYFVRMQSNGFHTTEKIVIAR